MGNLVSLMKKNPNCNIKAPASVDMQKIDSYNPAPSQELVEMWKNCDACYGIFEGTSLEMFGPAPPRIFHAADPDIFERPLKEKLDGKAAYKICTIFSETDSNSEIWQIASDCPDKGTIFGLFHDYFSVAFCGKSFKEIIQHISRFDYAQSVEDFELNLRDYMFDDYEDEGPLATDESSDESSSYE